MIIVISFLSVAAIVVTAFLITGARKTEENAEITQPDLKMQNYILRDFGVTSYKVEKNVMKLKINDDCHKVSETKKKRFLCDIEEAWQSTGGHSIEVVGRDNKKIA